MKKVYLIRHAKTRGNIERKYVGRTDEDLSREGALELTLRKGRYPDVELLFASPMKRCVRTAEIIYEAKKPRLIPGLKEYDFGIFENKSHDELKDDPAYIAWMESGGRGDIPDGEGFEQFKARCFDAFTAVLEEMNTENADTAAVVAHGGTIMVIAEKYAAECRDEPEEGGDRYYRWFIGNCEMLELTVEDGQVVEIRRLE